MKQRGIGDRLSLLTRGMGRPQGTRAPGRQIALWERSGRSLRGCGLEPRDEVVEAELLEPLTDRLELSRRELDQALALGAELERLAQAGLVRVEPAGDFPQPLDGALVGSRFSCHSVPPRGRARARGPCRRPCAPRTPSSP